MTRGESRVNGDSMIRTLSLSFALAIACLAAVAFAQNAPAPPALSQAVSATRAVKADYAFDLQMNSANQNWRAHYQPTGSPRLRLIEPTTLDKDAQGRFNTMAASSEGVRWCASDDMASAQNVRFLREDESSATYAFQPSAEMMRRGQGGGAQGGQRAQAQSLFQGGGASNRMQGEFTITKQNPDITQMRIFTPQAFSPMPMVRMERISFTIRCAVAPNGRRYAAETEMEMRISALGRRYDQHSVQRATNLTAP